MLTVEDNLINQRLLQKISGKLGVPIKNILQAYDGEEALDILEKLSSNGEFPDLMMVDCAMPRMDGYTFLEEFGNRWPARRLKIVGLTASSVCGEQGRTLLSIGPFPGPGSMRGDYETYENIRY
ncbi:hypothetical protein ABW19_dt0200129 [Dactylella cylindrospora]|nr:hypothetical protein ABW19_dt0200129 [Dactylella cylindrospora]